MSEERALYRAKPHWFYLARPGFLILLGMVAALAGYYYDFDLTLLGIGGALFGVAFLVLMVVLFQYRAWNLFITNRRVILKSGVFSRRVRELNLRQIESVFVDDRLLGKWFKYGTVVVVGVGGIKLPIVLVNKPHEVHGFIQRALTFPQPAAEYKHCTHCGAKNAVMVRFCRACGSEF